MSIVQGVATELKEEKNSCYGYRRAKRKKMFVLVVFFNFRALICLSARQAMGWDRDGGFYAKAELSIG